MKLMYQSMIVCLASGLMLAGCANYVKKEELAEVRALAEQAAAQAAEANAAADEAKAIANEAAATARDAKAQSEETESKIDRMFKKSMYK